jgi:hypothetical protein
MAAATAGWDFAEGIIENIGFRPRTTGSKLGKGGEWLWCQTAIYRESSAGLSPFLAD